MFSVTTSGALFGISSYLVLVEVDTATGLPGFSMVGFPGSEVREAGERVRVAIRNSGVKIPPMRITVNLSPAGVRKEGTAFDLPVAVGILTSLGYIRQDKSRRVLVIGELGLDGEVKAVKGILPVVMRAKQDGCDWCIVPRANASEGAVVEGICVTGVETLRQVMDVLNDGRQTNGTDSNQGSDMLEAKEGFFAGLPDYADVNGQSTAKRAAEIAAAGFHNLLLAGPPGAGKTMIARRLPSILPPLSREEMMEITSIYSVAGLLEAGRGVVARRPFVNPHHTVTERALAGGGVIPRPGLISLAHRGVLFLDEMAEFRRSVLDVLRQPLEDKKICIARNNGSYMYPSDFMLVGAINPCPCGYFPDLRRCRCSATQIRHYMAKMSGPILDRIDIGVEMRAVPIKEMTDTTENESSACIRGRVLKARRIQEERYQDAGIRFNAGLGAQEIKKYCFLGQKEKLFMENICKVTGFSARAYFKVLKVARTIADLEGNEKIQKSHLAEAAAFRSAGAFADQRKGDKSDD